MKIQCNDCGKSFDKDNMLQIEHNSSDPSHKYDWVDESCYEKNHKDEKIYGYGWQIRFI